MNKEFYIDIDRFYSLIFKEVEDKDYSSNVITASYGLDGSDNMELMSKEVTEQKESTYDYEKFVIQTKYDFLIRLIDMAAADNKGFAFNTLRAYGIIMES